MHHPLLDDTRGLVNARTLLVVVLAALMPACAQSSKEPERSAPSARATASGAPTVSPLDLLPLATPPRASASVASPAFASAAPTPSSAPSTSASAAAEEVPKTLPTLPRVKVENIGMHIGGGPNDAVTKAPIADSVKPHFDELKWCFAKAEDPTQGGSFGVDLLIERAGGKAEVTKPRTVIKGDAFRDCVVGVFEGIEFLKPKRGKTKVSYSVRFTP